MAKEQQEIKVKVTFTEGYEKRFTQAVLDVLEKRERQEKQSSSLQEVS